VNENSQPGPPLLMVRLLPNLALLDQWTTATGQAALRDDLGYALHAAMRATLGDLAPKPFALLRRPHSVQLIGYSEHQAQALEQALAQAALTDPMAARALGMGLDEAVVKPMPQSWHSGQVLSFETRVAPVVRSRQAAGTDRPGAYPEVDVAYHPDYAGDHPGNRSAAYQRWLQRELARAGAATLLEHRQVGFELTNIARRTQRRAGSAASLQDTTAPLNAPQAPHPNRQRSTQHRLLPDWTARGQLRVDNSDAFTQLLARGLGRHRSFGYGCLLLAPAGAWS
jgi:CRISPR system Cascade subunit CasE